MKKIKFEDAKLVIMVIIGIVTIIGVTAQLAALLVRWIIFNFNLWF